MRSKLALALLLLLCVGTAFAQARRPIIGINMDVSGSTETESARFALGSSYIDAITSAGGTPLLLPAVLSKDVIRAQVQACDGFVFTGGRDVNPSRYGEEPHPAWSPLNPRREVFDFALADEVLKSRKPFLAVCLGSQAINVALGGSLLQDIPTLTSSTIDHKPHAPRHEPAHEITITTNSNLAKLVGSTTLGVNSIHHQSCKAPGKGVRFVAHAPDGVVEAWEVKDHPFGLGVQWHPESMTSETAHLNVYKGLVDAARRARRR